MCLMQNRGQGIHSVPSKLSPKVLNRKFQHLKEQRGKKANRGKIFINFRKMKNSRGRLGTVKREILSH